MGAVGTSPTETRVVLGWLVCRRIAFLLGLRRGLVSSHRKALSTGLPRGATGRCTATEKMAHRRARPIVREARRRFRRACPGAGDNWLATRQMGQERLSVGLAPTEATTRRTSEDALSLFQVGRPARPTENCFTPDRVVC